MWPQSPHFNSRVNFLSLFLRCLGLVFLTSFGNEAHSVMSEFLYPASQSSMPQPHNLPCLSPVWVPRTTRKAQNLCTIVHALPYLGFPLLHSQLFSLPDSAMVSSPLSSCPKSHSLVHCERASSFARITFCCCELMNGSGMDGSAVTTSIIIP